MKGNLIHEVTGLLFRYDEGDAKRINHALKVHAFARHIAIDEGCDDETLELIEIAGLLHDIGIHKAEALYGTSAGKYQEELGPAVARELLRDLPLAPETLDRLCYLIANHHHYDKIDGIDYQILVEADFLVNIYEDGMKEEKIRSIREKIFRTTTGLSVLECLYGV
ncbi:MAG: HD domain-containing protein [Fusobacteriaceae bacterium]|jgi:HD superfamily phosphodiesterase|nr:HD domain-containing protein [Fusobacteriaceae bacterium]